MKIDILTIFPEMFEGVLKTSIVGRAIGTEAVEIKIHNLRDWSTDNYKSVDGRPFGGGAGMVMRVDVVERAVQELKNPPNGEAGGEFMKVDINAINERVKKESKKRFRI